MQATAKTTSVEQGEENLPDGDDEEEREVNLNLPRRSLGDDLKYFCVLHILDANFSRTSCFY